MAAMNGRYRRRKALAVRVLCAALVAAALPGQALAAPPVLPDLGDASEAALPPQAEHALGEQAMHNLRAEGGYFNDPEVNAYLNSLGFRLISSDPSIGDHFEFFAVDDPNINAFALPGGFIGVNTGLILAAETESELASVLAHEISHVTQHHIARSMMPQPGSQLISAASIAAAILAAKSGNSQAASAAMASITAAQQQSRIDHTRENELEADRIGFQLLDKAGFDLRAMPDFFAHLERVERIQDGQVPGYLRDHPLTYERIAEAQDRAYGKPYRQVADSLGFYLVRALLRSYEGETENTIARLSAELAEGRYRNQTAARYGLAAALLRGKDYPRAMAQINALDRSGIRHPMIEALAGQILQQSGQLGPALSRYRTALKRYPDHLQLVYDYPRTLMLDKQFPAAASFSEAQLATRRNDATLHQIAAEAYAALGRQTQSHFHQGEYYAALGNLPGAAEQLQMAIRANDGNFQDLLVAENRLKELRGQLHESEQGGTGRGKGEQQSPATQQAAPDQY